MAQIWWYGDLLLWRRSLVGCLRWQSLLVASRPGLRVPATMGLFDGV